MFKAFCPACKQHIEAADEKDYRRSGHVVTQQEAHDKYKMNTNRLPRDVKVGEYA